MSERVPQDHPGGKTRETWVPSLFSFPGMTGRAHGLRMEITPAGERGGPGKRSRGPGRTPTNLSPSPALWGFSPQRKAGKSRLPWPGGAHRQGTGAPPGGGPCGSSLSGAAVLTLTANVLLGLRAPRICSLVHLRAWEALTHQPHPRPPHPAGRVQGRGWRRPSGLPLSAPKERTHPNPGTVTPDSGGSPVREAFALEEAGAEPLS